ncbi:MAG: DUF4349 domain-containing protein [Microscillaceae bacterium]
MQHFFMWAMLVLGLSACGAGSYPSQSTRSEIPPYSEAGQQQQERLLIYQASLTLIVDEPEALSAKLQSLAEQHQGYLQKTGTEVVVMRVRNESLEMVLSEIEKMGKVKQKQISGEDVTENYQDLKIRIENGEKLRERYLDLLQKASEVEDLLQIERELERLNTELDLLKGRQNHLEKESALATIYIDIQKKVRPGPVGAIFVGLYKGLRWLFVWR